MTERLSTLFTFTGAPGVGKSTAIKQLENISRMNGISFFEAGDYPILKRYAQANRKKTHIVVWPIGSLEDSDDFMIVPAAYEEVSTHVAGELAQEILSRLSSYLVIASEVAMGAGIPPTNYGEHYFNILSQVLATQVRLANIQLDMPVDILRKRANDRYEDKSRPAPPPEVTDRYIDNNGLVQSSLPYVVSSGFNWVANEMVDNSGGPKETEKLLFSIFSRVLELNP